MRALWVALAAAACGSSGTAPKGPAASGPPDAGLPTPAEIEQVEAQEEEARREEAQINAIETAVNSQAAEIHRCWEKAAADDFRLEGRIALRLTFGEGSRVAAAEPIQDEPRDKVLTDCLAELYRVYEWTDLFAAGDQVELPFSFVAPMGQYTVRRADARAYGNATLLLDEANSGNPAVGLTRLELPAGATIPLHRHGSAELLYVVAGEGTLTSFGKPRAVGAGDAIYIAAGVAHGFASAKGVTAIQLYTPAGPEQRFKPGGRDAGTVPVGPGERKRGPVPVVIDVDRLRALPIGEVGMVKIAFDARSARDGAAYLGLLTAGPGMEVPEHSHAAETEVLYVLKGAGVMTVAGQEHPVEAEMAIQIPRALPHAFKVTSTEPVVALQYYSPSGPEQRFRGAKAKR